MLRKKTVFLMFTLSFLFLVVTFENTYSKYRTSASGESNMQIARWNIVVNNETISTNEQTINTLSPYFLNNDNIADGYIAPSAIGYFDIIIDASAVDVSFSYDIATSIAVDSLVDDLVIIGYSIDGGAIIDVIGEFTGISEEVLLASTNKIRNVRLYVKWEDENNATMDNINDTMAALNSGFAKVDVNLNFKQIID